MIYQLSKEIDKSKANRYFTELLEKGATIELKKKRKRTLNQNNYLHLILGWYALEYGASLDFIKQEYYKKLVNREIFVFQRKVKTGAYIEEVRSSRELDSAEMTKAIERFRNWSASDEGGNIYLPKPNEEEFLREIEVLISQNKY